MEAKEYFESDLYYLAGSDFREIKLKSKQKPAWSFKLPPKKELKDDLEDELKLKATEGMNLFVNAMFSLAREQGNSDRCILPEPKEILPRYKPLPQKRPETKWEKYAKEKGIKKRKRERMLWNEEAQKWKPRYGYDPNRKQEEWLVELDDKDDPTQNKFVAKRREKKLRVLKNKKKQLNNIKARSKENDLFGIGKETDAKGRRAMKGKKGTKRALNQAQLSTASLGNFDKKQKGEGDILKKKKKKHFDNLDIRGEDIKRRDQRIANSVLKNY